MYWAQWEDGMKWLNHLAYQTDESEFLMFWKVVDLNMQYNLKLLSVF